MGNQASNIPIISSEEFIFNHGELAKQARAHPERGNDDGFRAELPKLRDGWNGKFVVFQAGTFCGAGNDGERLFKTAGDYYGYSSLAVYEIKYGARSPEVCRICGRG